jgi:hypothetical protein
VAKNQSAFVRGRSIHHNYMLVQHSIKALHRKKITSLFLKLDITKAFDFVSWVFLLKVLSHLGFGPKWCGLFFLSKNAEELRLIILRRKNKV